MRLFNRKNRVERLIERVKERAKKNTNEADGLQKEVVQRAKRVVKKLEAEAKSKAPKKSAQTETNKTKRR